MSQYLFHCEDCNKEFTQSLHMSDVDKAGITCPHCGGMQVLGSPGTELEFAL